MSNKKLISELLHLSPSTIIELFELDLTSLGDSVYTFYNGTNDLETDIVWQGVTYEAFPLQITGFETSGNAQIPRPTMLVSNILGIMGTLASDFNDLIGAKVTRKRTFAKYLDAINFSAGNPDADSTVEFEDDVYYISKKTLESNILIEFELTASWDVQGVELPRRLVSQNTCSWEYRGSECGYAGGPVADVYDVPTSDAELDSCSKKLQGCELRFGENNELPYGGFPGAGLLR